MPYHLHPRGSLWTSPSCARGRSGARFSRASLVSRPRECKKVTRANAIAGQAPHRIARQILHTGDHASDRWMWRLFSHRLLRVLRDRDRCRLIGRYPPTQLGARMRSGVLVARSTARDRRTAPETRGRRYFQIPESPTGFHAQQPSGSREHALGPWPSLPSPLARQDAGDRCSADRDPRCPPGGPPGRRGRAPGPLHALRAEEVRISTKVPLCLSQGAPDDRPRRAPAAPRW